MATFFEGESHTFSEYLLVPGYSSAENIPANVSLKTPLVRFKRGEESPITLNIPMVSAIMQSVSGPRLAIALAQEGGISFIYGSQPAAAEAAMVREVKSYKAGFVVSDSTLTPDMTLEDVLDMVDRTGHSTMPVTEDGTPTGKFCGIVTSRDYRVSRDARDKKVREFMTPAEKTIVAEDGTSLKVANDLIWEHKLNALPIVDKDGNLVSLVFRKDYDSHKSRPNELLDQHKRYMVGAGINTRDYAERVPLLVEAGADVLCIDSSEGFSEWQKRTLEWIHAELRRQRQGRRWQRRGRRGLPLSGRLRRRLRQGGHRRRLHLHHPRDQGHRPRPGHGPHRRLPRPVTSTSRRPASTCPSARTAASSTTTT